MLGGMLVGVGMGVTVGVRMGVTVAVGMGVTVEVDVGSGTTSTVTVGVAVGPPKISVKIPSPKRKSPALSRAMVRTMQADISQGPSWPAGH